jgi:hypothetical protein
MGIRDAIRSFWTWLSGEPRPAPDPVSGQPNFAPGPASETARPFSAANDDELRAAFKTLTPGQRGYITAEDYEEITAEELDEFSVESIIHLHSAATSAIIWRPACHTRTFNEVRKPSSRATFLIAAVTRFR